MKRIISISITIVLLQFIPVFASASDTPAPFEIYEKSYLERVLSRVWFDATRDYSSYLFGEKLNPVSFYAAYSAMTGQEVTDDMKKAAEAMFKQHGNWRPETSTEDWSVLSPIDTWRSAASAIVNEPPGSHKKYFDDQICPDGAITAALASLEDRKKNYTAQELKTWVENQNKVFVPCEIDSLWEPRSLAPRCTWNQGQENVRLSLWGRIKRFFGFSDARPSFLCSDDDISGPKDASVRLMQDIAYQRAARHLYRGGLLNTQELQEAQRSFEAISRDESNPWSAYAKIGQIRSMIRELDGINNELNTQARGDINNYEWQAKLFYNSDSALREKSKAALEVVEASLSDQKMHEYRDQLLLQREMILARLVDSHAAKDSCGVVVARGSDATHHLAICMQQYQLNASGRVVQARDSTIDMMQMPEFLRYVWYWNSENTTDLRAKIRREYDQSPRKSLWSVLLLRKISQDPSAITTDDASLVESALRQGVSNNLYWQLQYYANAVLFLSDSLRAATNIATLLSKTNVPDIAFNFFSDLAMSHAKSLDEMIRYGERRTSFIQGYGYSYGFERSNGIISATLGRLGAKYDDVGYSGKDTLRSWYDNYKFRGKEQPTDGQLIDLLNYGVPIDSLLANEYLANRYAGQILTRALLLGRNDITKGLAGKHVMGDQALRGTNDTTTQLQQDFGFVYAILHSTDPNREDPYGIAIHNRNFNNSTNDWHLECAACGGYSNYDNKNGKEYHDFDRWMRQSSQKEYSERVLSEDERKENTREKEKLLETPIVKFLGDIILSYAKENPNDSRVPEALAGLVEFYRNNYRYAPFEQDQKTQKKAFEYLHKNYPNSSWAKNTPYYY